MSTLLVSICIPTHNRPELLERAVRSCLVQTFKDFEIIITDNGDNDASRDVVARLADPRIRYYKDETCVGPWANGNRAAALATGNYIKFLMDDDLMKPECLARMVEALEKHPSAGVAMAPMDIIDAEDRRIFPRFYVFRRMEYRYRYQVGDGLIDRRRILKDFLTRDYPCCVPSGVLYRGEAFRRQLPTDEETGFAGDLAICMYIATRYDFYYIDQVLSSWRHFPDNQTAKMHQAEGLDIGVFYYITRTILEDKEAMRLFPAADRSRLVRDSLFFCSCRSLLNGLAGLRARDPRLIRRTAAIIYHEDKCFWNWLRLPWFVVREIFVSVFPRHLPPPKE
jgi:glycosyltransferase involved in cell wall biosynthesis